MKDEDKRPLSDSGTGNLVISGAVHLLTLTRTEARDRSGRALVLWFQMIGVLDT